MDIFKAIEQNDVSLVQAIINRDKLVILEKNKYHQTVLHIACKHNRLDIARSFIDAGADVHARDNKARTPLHLACAISALDVARLLVDAGSDVNARDEDDWTPLHSSCYYNRIEVPELLIKAGADANAKTNRKSTPLHVACRYGFTVLAQLFIAADASVDWLSVNQNGRTPIDSAIDHNETEFLHFLEGFIDQLPLLEQKKLRAWRFRKELTKTS